MVLRIQPFDTFPWAVPIIGNGISDTGLM